MRLARDRGDRPNWKNGKISVGQKYLYRVDPDDGRIFGIVILRMLMAVGVHVAVMMAVMLEARRSSVPLPGVRVARVQRMHLL